MPTYNFLSDVHVHVQSHQGKSKRDVAAVNRTRGSCMASTNFTTKPLRRTYEQNSAKIVSNAMYLFHGPGDDTTSSQHTPTETTPFQESCGNSVLSAFPTLV
jgi:hypothetical protein